MGFNAITTQEELDSIISDRIGREREASEKRYAGYLSPEDVEKKYGGYLSPEDVEKVKGDYDGQIQKLTGDLAAANEKAAKDAEDIRTSAGKVADLEAKVKSYEAAALREKVAHEAGLPYGMSKRLQGESEEELKKDAESLSKLIGARKAAPFGSSEPVDTAKGDKESALRRMVEKLNS